MENPQESHQPATHTGGHSDKDKALGAIAYIGPLFILSFLLAENSKFVKFHAAQGLVFFVAFLIVRFVLGAILMSIFVPSYGAVGMMYGGGTLMMLINLLFVLLGLFAIVKAVQGEEWEMPLLGGWAKKIKL